MRSYRIYTETTTTGMVREVYGIEGGGTGDTYVIEYPQATFILPHGTLTKPEINY